VSAVPASTFTAAQDIRAIDTRMAGRERVTSAYLVEADEPALVETGPTTSRDAVLAGLRELGVGAEDLAHIVVTHIHLDHAGGVGALAPHFPQATVWVHERGAPHLADPTRLMKSAERIYGVEGLRTTFGPVEPVPSERLRSLTGGDAVPLGNRSLEAIYTPGHAGHHVCLVDSDTGGVFVGDALGVFLPDLGILRPATPPPEFNLELAVESVGMVAEREPPILLFSHFGPADHVAHLCALAVQRLQKWTAEVERILGDTDETEEIVRRLREATRSELQPAAGRLADLEDRYELLSSYEMNVLGIVRYLTTRRESRAGSS
jgi:glyoxylase-like metal-dependent hydrolase (beta-lactamase superfamily II)